MYIFHSCQQEALHTLYRTRYNPCRGSVHTRTHMQLAPTYSAERQVRPANAACWPGTKMNYVEVHGSDANRSHVLYLHRSPEPRGRVLLLRVDARHEHLALGATTSAFCSLAVFADGRRRRWHAQALTARRGHILCKAPGLQTVRHGSAARRWAPRARKARVAVIGRRFGRGRPREKGQRWKLFASGI